MLRREVALHLVQEERDLVEQALRRPGALYDDRARIATQPLFIATLERTAGVDDHGRERKGFARRHFVEQVVARHVRQREIEHHAVESALPESLQRLGAGRDRDDVYVLGLQKLNDALPLNRDVLDDEHVPEFLFESLLDLPNRLNQLLSLDGFEEVADCPHRKGLLCVLQT